MMDVDLQLRMYLVLCLEPLSQLRMYLVLWLETLTQLRTYLVLWLEPLMWSTMFAIYQYLQSDMRLKPITVIAPRVPLAKCTRLPRYLVPC